jgi:Na+-translocating ferredoxin:NAD+ oxidoreductase RNF subunit RnfB
MAHLGKACDAPMDICMTFGNTADSLARHGVARRVDTAECLDLLQQARDRGLVQFGENVRERVSFICNCCGCCCEAMIAARRFSFMKPVHTTNFLPALKSEACLGCGQCVNACPVEALALVSAHDPHHHAAKKVQLNEELCLGCGVCVRACTRAALHLRPRKQRVLTPANTAHRTVLMAIERGTFAELLVDGQSTYGHRAVSAILGAVLKLPPLKQALASKQMKSRYLDRLMTGP